MNAPIDNHSWDCDSKESQQNRGHSGQSETTETHRLSLQLLSIAQKEHGRAGLCTLEQTMCCGALFVGPENHGTPQLLVEHASASVEQRATAGWGWRGVGEQGGQRVPWKPGRLCGPVPASQGAPEESHRPSQGGAASA